MGQQASSGINPQRFSIGDKVKCIDPGPYKLSKDTIFTIKHYHLMAPTCVVLMEETPEPGYYEERFEIFLPKETLFDKLYLKLKYAE